MTEMFALTVGQSTVSVGQGRAVNVLCADAATPDSSDTIAMPTTR